MSFCGGVLLVGFVFILFFFFKVNEGGRGLFFDEASHFRDWLVWLVGFLVQ